MINDLPFQTTTVAALLSQAPQAARVFLSLRTACVGCYLAKFCTLADVARTYHLDKAAFRRDLSRLIAQPLNEENP